MKTFLGQTRYHQSRHKSSGSRQAFYLQAGLQALPHQQKTRIGNSGCAGVGDQSNVFSGLYARHHLLNGFMLVKFMMRLHGRADVVMFQ